MKSSTQCFRLIAAVLLAGTTGPAIASNYYTLTVFGETTRNQQSPVSNTYLGYYAFSASFAGPAWYNGYSVSVGASDGSITAGVGLSPGGHGGLWQMASFSFPVSQIAGQSVLNPGEYDLYGNGSFSAISTDSYLQGLVSFYSGTISRATLRVIDVPAVWPDPAAPSYLQPSHSLSLGPAIPEPASWTMLIAGFGIVGAALRRRAACIRTVPSYS